MKIEIVNKNRNELLKRNEIVFRVDYEKSGTPSNADVRKKIADMLSVEVERVHLRKNKTKRGSMTTLSEASLYDTADQAKYVEADYILQRSVPKAEKEKEKAEKKPKEEKKEKGEEK